MSHVPNASISFLWLLSRDHQVFTMRLWPWFWESDQNIKKRFTFTDWSLTMIKLYHTIKKLLVMLYIVQCNCAWISRIFDTKVILMSEIFSGSGCRSSILRFILPQTHLIRINMATYYGEENFVVSRLKVYNDLIKNGKYWLPSIHRVYYIYTFWNH